jgi:hypothetical protein
MIMYVLALLLMLDCFIEILSTAVSEMLFETQNYEQRNFSSPNFPAKAPELIVHPRVTKQ